jgi:hypothetical protein
LAIVLTIFATKYKICFGTLTIFGCITKFITKTLDLTSQHANQ